MGLKISIRLGSPDGTLPPKVEDEGNPRLSPDDQWVTVPAQVLGTLAVHESRNGQDEVRWGVTHVLCGLLITHLSNREDAVRVAEHLWKNYRTALEIEDHKKTRKMVPQYVKDWLSQCRRTGRWVDPE